MTDHEQTLGPPTKIVTVCVDERDKRIAELTAELAEARYRIDRMIEDHDVTRAELAALKARRCDGCEHDEVCEVAPAAWRQFEVQPFSCACWAERWPG